MQVESAEPKILPSHCESHFGNPIPAKPEFYLLAIEFFVVWQRLCQVSGKNQLYQPNNMALWLHWKQKALINHGFVSKFKVSIKTSILSHANKTDRGDTFLFNQTAEYKFGTHHYKNHKYLFSQLSITALTQLCDGCINFNTN